MENIWNAIIDGIISSLKTFPNKILCTSALSAIMSGFATEFDIWKSYFQIKEIALSVSLMMISGLFIYFILHFGRRIYKEKGIITSNQKIVFIFMLFIFSTIAFFCWAYMSYAIDYLYLGNLNIFRYSYFVFIFVTMIAWLILTAIQNILYNYIEKRIGLSAKETKARNAGK